MLAYGTFLFIVTQDAPIRTRQTITLNSRQYCKGVVIALLTKLLIVARNASFNHTARQTGHIRRRIGTYRLYIFGIITISTIQTPSQRITRPAVYWTGNTLLRIISRQIIPIRTVITICTVFTVDAIIWTG
jgi:hypothetical protein